MLALHTGMRRGELQALQWEDVDLVAGTLRIRRDKAGEGRWVVLNSEAREALMTVKREQKMLGPYVFCSPEGKFLHNFERDWRPALEAAKIPDFRFHDCRHTFASRLAMARRGPLHRPAGRRVEDSGHGPAVRPPQPRPHQGRRRAPGHPSGSATGTKTGTDGSGEKLGTISKCLGNGAPGGNRTPDPRLRRPMLYPTELRARTPATARGDSLGNRSPAQFVHCALRRPQPGTAGRSDSQ